IDAALALARDFPLRMTLVHADQAAELAPAIARAGASVVLPPLTPYSPRETLRLAAALAKAGVRIAFGSDAPDSDPGSLRTSAALGVGCGRAGDGAWRALTLAGAQVAGVDRSTGSIDPDKDADIAVFDGPPLAASTRLLRVYAQGRLVYEAPKAAAEK